MSTLSTTAQDVLDYIDSKSLTESEYNEVLDELIEKEPGFQDIFDRLVDAVSTYIPELGNLRPGGKIMRVIKIIALQNYEFLDKGIEEQKKQMFVQTATGLWLDGHGKDVGLERKTLAKATGTLLVGSSLIPDTTYTLPELFMAGTTGSEDQESVKFLGLTTPSIDPSTQPDADGDYTVELQIEAEKGGDAGNLDPGMITEIFTKVEYFDLVKQKTSTTGGYDQESDDDYRNRILQKKQELVIYSIPWFKSEAESFTGAQEALIIPIIHGEGTVGIAIRGTGTSVPQSLVDQIQAHFDSETVKPLSNWRAFVSAIATYTNDIQMDVYYKTGLPVQESDLQSAVETYFSALAIGDSYIRQMMETKIGQVINVYNFSTTTPTQDIIDPPDASTLIVLGTVVFNLIEVT